MAKHSFLFLFTFFVVQHLCVSISILNSLEGRSLISTDWQPMQCNSASFTPTCSSYLYVIPNGRTLADVASDFGANASLFQDIKRLSGSEDLLVRVPCMCEAFGNDTTTAFFHDTSYIVKPNDTPDIVSSTIFSGLAWNLGDGKILKIKRNIMVHLPCGCSSIASEGVLSYAVQEGDILSNIANLFRSNWQAIVNLNPTLKNPDFLKPGWVLFIPMGIAGEGEVSGSRNKNTIVLATSISAAFFLICVFTIILRLKRRSRRPNIEDPRVERVPSNRSIAALESHFFPSKKIDDIDPFQTERPVIFSLKAVEDATANFDEKRKIGEGGYGSVYLGFIGTHEIAIKKMKASKSKEFFAELKVLCKVHHINVVELIGYAAGEDNLYLVYEYVQNGSLSEHLHDPLLKGHQPLSWTARTQIALDAARGIEYIHDHTKACYVHRDIKTSNILLDNGLRAKVADFGLVKLVQRSEEEECLATRLVGTPGYLPPESVLELHMTTKSDVYAFGVVLAELTTGLRALVRDNKEANKMKSLITIMKNTFGHEDLESSLEGIIDRNLKDNYPIDEVCKLANISMWCLSDDPLDRPEMREIMLTLSQIHMASIEWEASLGGDGEVFSGVFNGR